MLRLIDIRKDYPTSSMTVRALKGVSINFRTSEFVSILGPSGCGKTTMLNIIGGLDKLTAGDLQINGRSTKDFKSADWDVYRNHRIGFVFQSYNLIPHQTVLSNVELALTIAGVDKATRREKARAALEKVGLGDQTHKKPNQLSGGQCQRVAIARALVNDPEILLADEPTGALDTETSKQIMNLIQEISKERLVIMVTHNPELAQEYSTRIIHLLDGLLKSDSNSLSDEEAKVGAQNIADNAQSTADNAQLMSADNNLDQHNSPALPSAYDNRAEVAVKKEKAKMSFFTAFKLSLSNLFTKKARTIVMAIASAIGIIGVSLVLAISFGIQNFITDMQHDMLAGNPIQVNQTGFDFDAMGGMMGPQDLISFDRNDGFVNVEGVIANLYEMIGEMDDIFVQNRIDRNYLQFLMQMPEHYFSAMHFNYGLNTTYSFFNRFNDQHTSITGIIATYAAVLQHVEGFEEFAGLLGMLGNPIRQSPDFSSESATEYLRAQFDIFPRPGHAGDGIARDKNEVMIVLGRDHVLTDIMLGQLGVFDQDEFINIVHYITGHDYYDPGSNLETIPFERLFNQEFVWQPNNNIFSEANRFENMAELMGGDNFGTVPFQYNPVMDINSNDGVELTVVGILSPKDDVSFVMMEPGVFYTRQLAEYIIYRNWNSYLIEFMRERALNSLTGTTMNFVLPEGAPPLHMLPNNIPIPVIAIGGHAVPFYVDYEYLGQRGRVVSFVGGGGDSLMGLFMANMGGGGGGGLDGITISSIGMRQFGGSVYTINIRETDADGNYIRRYERATDADGEYLVQRVRLIAEGGGYQEGYARVIGANGQYQRGLVRQRCPSCLSYLYNDDGTPMYAIGYVYAWGYLYESVYQYAPVRAVDADGEYLYYDNGDAVYEFEYESVVHFDAEGNVTPLANSISIFSSSFDQVDSVTAYLRSWNGSGDIVLEFADGTSLTLTAEERDRVQYTDMLSLIMSMVSQLIQIITIALVSFTALSLVVSSVMIGILTYVSVMERTKEIGVIRSLGGRKKDVSNLFTAETFILGFAAGLFGIVITYILQGIVNLIVGFFAGMTIAALPIWVAAIMVGVSVLLTVVAGAMPSRSAAKKDPVVALRTE